MQTIMKISKYVILPAFLILVLAACQKEGVLKNDTQTDIFDADVWADSLKTTQILTSVYADLGPESMLTRVNSFNSLSEFTDESDARYAASGVGPTTNFQKGIFSPTSLVDPFTNMWANTYKSIRKACLFIENVDRSPLSPAIKKRMKAEARFLRAYYYHLLIKHYAGVPLLDRTLLLTEDFDLPRNTYQECVDYIIKDLNEAAPDLPIDYIAMGRAMDYGRATKGACMALKARVLLFAASPLFNGSADDPNPIFGYPTYDPARWVKAAEAAKAVIDMSAYELLEGTNGDNSTAEGYYKLYLTRVNKEIIFQRLSAANRSLENAHLPVTCSASGDSFHNHPNGAYVNAFPMKNGKAIKDPTSGYNPQDPYVNRDPRFYRSIIYNGAVFLNKSNVKAPVYTYLGAPSDGLTLPYTGGTQTGYYNRKMMTEDAGSAQHFFPFLRYAEVLLNYAEALNESGQTALAYDPIIQIRKRAGIDAGADVKYGLKAGMSQNEMRVIIRDERRVELSYEEHRFWDIRRWKIGPETYGKNLTGMKIVKTGSTYTYEEFTLTKPSVWLPGMNLMPIPQTQINISAKLIQNPKW